MARWLEALPGAHDEIAGHHLAEAHAARAALGEPDPELAARGGGAARRRRRRRAAARRSVGGRAPAGARGVAARGRRAAARARRRAVRGGPRRGRRERARAGGRAARTIRGSAPARWSSSSSSGSRPDPAAAGHVPDAEWAALDGDDQAECRVWLLRGRLAWDPGRVAEADEAWARAGERAEEAGLHRRPVRDRRLARGRGGARARARRGRDPAPARGSATLVAASPIATASVLNPLAYLLAMRGDFAGAEALLAEAGAILDELGGLGAGVSHLEAFVRLLAGQPERAEALLRGDVELLSAMVEGSALATTTALLARAVLAQGRADEAGRAGGRGRPPHGAAGRAHAGALARRARPVRWRTTGRRDEALALASEAVAVLEPTDLLSHRGDAMLDLAAVLSISGQREESERAVRSAVALYERKGNAVAAAAGAAAPRQTDKEVGDVRPAEHPVPRAEGEGAGGPRRDRRSPAGDPRGSSSSRTARLRTPPVARPRRRREEDRDRVDRRRSRTPSFKKGQAQTMGVEVRADPFQIHTWSQIPRHRVGHGAGPDGRRAAASAASCRGWTPCRAGEHEIDALVEAMRAVAGVTPSTIPAGFTYLGQFIDHDITFDPTPFGDAPATRDASSTTARRGSTSTRSTGPGPTCSPTSTTREASSARLLLHDGPPLDLPRNDDRIAPDRRPAQRRER